MENQRLDAAIKLKADIEKLSKIKAALQVTNLSNEHHNSLLVARCLEELSTITSVAPIFDHLKALVDATLDANNEALIKI